MLLAGIGDDRLDVLRSRGVFIDVEVQVPDPDGLVCEPCRLRLEQSLHVRDDGVAVVIEDLADGDRAFRAVQSGHMEVDLSPKLDSSAREHQLVALDVLPDVVIDRADSTSLADHRQHALVLSLNSRPSLGAEFFQHGIRQPDILPDEAGDLGELHLYSHQSQRWPDHGCRRGQRRYARTGPLNGLNDLAAAVG